MFYKGCNNGGKLMNFFLTVMAGVLVFFRCGLPSKDDVYMGQQGL